MWLVQGRVARAFLEAVRVDRLDKAAALLDEAGHAEKDGKRFALTIPEWRVIAILGRFPGLSAVEVAERTMLDKVAVSRAGVSR